MLLLLFFFCFVWVKRVVNMFFDDFNDDELSTQQGGLLLSASSEVDTDHHDGATRHSNVVMELIYATDNERCCPTILPYPSSIVNKASALIVHHTKLAEDLEAEEQRAALVSADNISLLPFRPAGIMQADIQRVKFFMSELLRTRLSKIEMLCLAIAHEGASDEADVALTPPSGSDGAGLRSALSSNELMLAEQLAAMQKQCVLQGGLHLIPEPLQHLTPNPPHGEGAEMLPTPNTSAYVFVLALADLGSVTLDIDVEQDIRAGEIFLVPYKALAPFVVEGKARLV
jgi:GINS complex subunit 4